MTDTSVVETPPPPGPGPTSTGDRVRFVLRGIGQTLITLGLVVLLFVVYEVWITNLFAAREQSKVTNALKKEWKEGKDPLLPLPGSKDPSIPLGSGIGILYIPRLGRDFHFTIVQGSTVPDDAQLEKGPAHYKDTALPGQVGNFAVAGHRVGKGEPFLNIDKLRSGDSVIVETKTYWYVYQVLGTPAGQNPQDVHEKVRVSGGSVRLPGREIVTPDAGRVLDPVPDHPELQAATALMTMTTCHPKFTASHRMIVYSKLVTRLPVAKSNSVPTMPEPIKALYDEVKA